MKRNIHHVFQFLGSIRRRIRSQFAPARRETKFTYADRIAPVARRQDHSGAWFVRFADGHIERAK